MGDLGVHHNIPNNVSSQIATNQGINISEPKTAGSASTVANIGTTSIPVAPHVMTGETRKATNESGTTDMFKNSTFGKIFLKLFLTDTIFGTKDQRSVENESKGFKALVKNEPEITLTTKDGQQIKGFSFASFPPDPGRPTVVFMSGSFGPAGRYAAPIINAYLDKNYNVLVFDSVGFGRSQASGKPTPENFMQSAEAAVNFVKSDAAGDIRQTNNSKIILHGYSLGGFAAGHVASLEGNEGMTVVLDRVSGSGKNIAKDVMRDALPGTIGKIAGSLVGKILQSVLPYDIGKSLSKITKGAVVVLQSDNMNAEQSEKFRSIRVVEKMKFPDTVTVVSKKQAGAHIQREDANPKTEREKMPWTEKTSTELYSAWNHHFQRFSSSGQRIP